MRVMSRAPVADFDAIVVGAGHNGLITAAYLAKAGLRTMLLEARRDVGGTAASESFAGATVNICNCDHLTFRTTPVMSELDLASFGLQYIDVEPAQHHMAWSGGPAWTQYHDVERTLDALRSTHPGEVDGYRRYLSAAIPAVKLILSAACEPPSIRTLSRRAVQHRLAGVPTILRWSRRSAADVLRSFFQHDALAGTAAVSGPMVWGISPELPGSGLGALTHAMRHVASVGRPVGGSGMVPTSLARARTSTTAGSCASAAESRRFSATATRCAASRWATGSRSPLPSSSRRATRIARSSSGCATLPRVPATSCGAGAHSPIPTATSRRSTPSCRPRRVCGPSTRRSAPRRSWHPAWSRSIGPTA